MNRILGLLLAIAALAPIPAHAVLRAVAGGGGGGGSGTVTSVGTGCGLAGGTITTSPNWKNGTGTYSAPSDFQPNTTPSNSYLIGAGTTVPVWSDFFLAAQPSPRDIGAVNH